MRRYFLSARLTKTLSDMRYKLAELFPLVARFSSGMLTQWDRNSPLVPLIKQHLEIHFFSL